MVSLIDDFGLSVGRDQPRRPIHLNRADSLSNGLLAWFPVAESGTQKFNTTEGKLYQDFSGYNRHGLFTTEGAGQSLSMVPVAEINGFGYDNSLSISAFNLIALPDLTGLFPTGAGSFSMWLRNNPGNIVSPFGLSTSGFANHYPFSDTNLYLGILASTRHTITGNAGFDKTKYHMITVTTDPNDRWRLYQNDHEIFNTTPESTVVWASDYELGRDQPPNPSILPYDGLFAETAFWDRALLSSEVRRRYLNPHALYWRPGLRTVFAPSGVPPVVGDFSPNFISTYGYH